MYHNNLCAGTQLNKKEALPEGVFWWRKTSCKNTYFDIACHIYIRGV